MRFTKMHGIGNDFIVVDAINNEITGPNALAKRVCDRRTGIGGDGLILMCPSERGDAFMRIINSDGSEPEMCGNGVRCAAKFMYDSGLCRKQEIDIDTLAGVKHIALEIRDGEIVSLIGPSGSGKSTLLRCIHGLEKADSGEIANVPAKKAAVFQENRLCEDFSVLTNIKMVNDTLTDDVVLNHLEAVDLEDCAKQRVNTLSGGMKRRVALVRAILAEKEILFLDEPTLGLDVIARSELWEVIRSLKGRVTIILTTHYMEEAEALSDRIGVMREGRLLRCGTAAELKQAAGTDDFEQAFIRIVKEATV